MIRLPAVIPWWWKASAALVLVASLAAAGAAYRSHVWQLGHDAAVAERAARDAVAVLRRTEDNVVVAARQGAINTLIEKANHEELAPVRERIVTQRVYVGSAICGPATAPKTESAGGSDGTDPTRRLVREDVERDIRALKLAVEEQLAAGRACQAFVTKNGMAP